MKTATRPREAANYPWLTQQSEARQYANRARRIEQANRRRLRRMVMLGS